MKKNGIITIKKDDYPIKVSPTITKNGQEYGLCSIMLHIGPHKNSGHYKTVMSQWVYDDNSITCQKNMDVSKLAYCLIYSR